MIDRNLDRLSTTWDVFIAGAGPAGSMTALLLARLGHKVLLVERELFPRQKVCGCCLNAAAVGILRDAGLGHFLRDSHASELTTLVLEMQAKQCELPLSGHYALSRSWLDSALARAASEEGASFLSGVTARLEKTEAECCHIRLQTGDSTRVLRASVAVCADGLKGSFLSSFPDLQSTVSPDSRIGLSAFHGTPSKRHSPGTVCMAVGVSGYVGRVIVEDGSLNIAAAIDREILRIRGPAAAVALILEESGAAPLPDLHNLRWRGTPPLTRKRFVPAAHRLFVVGDAAGYEEPFTGEGIAWALGGPGLLAPLVSECLESWQEDAPLRWNDLMQKKIRKRQFWCRLIRHTLRHPTACAAAIQLVNLNSRWVSSLLNTLNQPIGSTK